MKIITKVGTYAGVAIIFLGFAVMYLADSELRKAVKKMWEIEDEISGGSIL